MPPVRLTITRQFQDFLVGCGIPLEPLLKQVGAPSLLDQERLEVTAEQYFQLFDAAGGRISDEQVLAITDIRRINTFQPVFYAALCSGDGRGAVDRLARYKRLLGPVDIHVTESGSGVSVVMRTRAPAVQPPRLLALYEQLVVLRTLRMGTGAGIVPRLVETPYLYGPAVARFLGTMPRVAATCRIVFNAVDLARPFVTRNNVMLEYLEPELRTRLAALDTDQGLIPALRRMLFSAVPAGDCSVEQAADSLGMSPRSLQRALAAAGTTFSEELRAVRRELAEYHLLNDDLSIGDIALLTGYQDTTSFMRAFKHWTGMSAGQFRSGRNGVPGLGRDEMTPVDGPMKSL